MIGFCFGALLEGVAGFGTPIAIIGSLLIMVGFQALEALTFTLIFDTAPVAFGALGVPITVLGAVTGLPAATSARWSAASCRSWRSFCRSMSWLVWRLALDQGVVAGAAGRRRQFRAAPGVTSNYINYALTDVLASLGSLIITLLFLQVWKPAQTRNSRSTPMCWMPSAARTDLALAGLAALGRSSPSS